FVGRNAELACMAFHPAHRAASILGATVDLDAMRFAAAVFRVDGNEAARCEVLGAGEKLADAAGAETAANPEHDRRSLIARGPTRRQKDVHLQVALWRVLEGDDAIGGTVRLDRGNVLRWSRPLGMRFRFRSFVRGAAATQRTKHDDEGEDPGAR